MTNPLPYHPEEFLLTGTRATHTNTVAKTSCMLSPFALTYGIHRSCIVRTACTLALGATPGTICALAFDGSPFRFAQQFVRPVVSRSLGSSTCRTTRNIAILLAKRLALQGSRPRNGNRITPSIWVANAIITSTRFAFDSHAHRIPSSIACRSTGSQLAVENLRGHPHLHRPGCSSFSSLL